MYIMDEKNLFLYSNYNSYIKHLPGNYSGSVTPDTIPNSEVKPFSADGTLS